VCGIMKKKEFFPNKPFPAVRIKSLISKKPISIALFNFRSVRFIS